MKTIVIALMSAAALLAPAAEVVVYSPKAESLHVSGAGRATAYPAEWTGHRSVCTVPGGTNDAFEAWTGGDAYSVGNPYGTSAGRAHPAIDLTAYSPIVPRIDVSTGASDRAPTIAAYVEGLYRIVWDLDITDDLRNNMLSDLVWTKMNRYEVAEPRPVERVRIVRWVVDGWPMYRHGVKPKAVVDQKMHLSNRAFLTEADVLATGALDIDWENLNSDVVNNFSVIRRGVAVTNVAYLVVIGDGKTYWEIPSDTNSVPAVLDRVVERRYEFRRTRPTPVGSSLARGVASFSFRIDGEEPAVSRYGSSYTACRVRVRRDGASDDAWTSGIQRIPAKDPASGVYTLSSSDPELANALASGSCTWSAALYNAKFSDNALYDTTGGERKTDSSTALTNVFSSAVLFTP